MTTETTMPAVETLASTVAQPVAKKPVKPVAKKAVKSVAKKATKKAVKSVTKKSIKPVAVRAQHIFTLASKANLEDFGSGQRLAIAKLIKKGATRADLIAKLPDVSAANISWHLSMMVKNGEAKKS